MKYYFWILGCAMNYSDAERISALFDSFGFQKTENEKEADIVCVIACSVRQHAVDRIYGKVKGWNETKKHRQLRTVLSGCVLEGDRKKFEKIFDFIFEVKDISKLTKYIEDMSLRAERSNLKRSPQVSDSYDDKIEGYGDYLNIHPKYQSPIRAYVPISTGCDNFCTYCAVPYTRGREKSRPIEEIIAEIRDLVKKGCKEITLLGQNVNSYGNDYSSNNREKSDSPQPAFSNNNKFIELIKIIDQIPGKYRVYFYSNHPKDISDELITVLPTLKHFPHYLHLPLQSGNDEILKEMNRHYTQEKYLGLVKKIRQALPDVLLTTDIIVGFPGESKEQFWDTLKVVKKARFEMIFLAQFSPRPGTKAAKMVDDVSKAEKKNRETLVNETLTKIVLENNEKLIGTTQEILVDEAKKDKLYGRTKGYKVVEIKKSPTVKIGDFINVKIESATAWKLFGKIELL
ncbi:MAG: tRNA (N6-isopentenyl adenosine(37)-C2)-methylthiotransferase MiaB [Patescibacteria group bacterium]|jgi:tRNA-2-methylthio-N6-dimethylallyladenosine synthase|nr:tRNA (N6-isopentenyl adenosine(37)-C2)-methylthiotransferase MiaB [Patescibacteria group bacterium]